MVRRSYSGCNPHDLSWRILPSTSPLLCGLLPASRSRSIFLFIYYFAGDVVVAYGQLFSFFKAQIFRCSRLVGIAGNEHLPKVSRRNFGDGRERGVHSLCVQAAVVRGDRHSSWSLILQGYLLWSTAIPLSG